MAAKKDDPGQSRPEPIKKVSYPSKLQPIEAALVQQGYPVPVIENYSKLIAKDLHLAELYRFTAKDSPATSKIISPIQARVDSKGRLWVDVIFERKEGVEIKDLKKIMRVHGNSRKSRIITGRIMVDDLPALGKMVLQLQTAQLVRSTLDESRLSIFADPQIHLANDFGGIDGLGVLVGIIDEGCDFKHPNFRKEDKKTRLLFLWDQNGKIGAGKNRPSKYTYGVEYSRDDINNALNDNNPYESLDYKPEIGAHGTYVMDIAAGNSKDPQLKGIAPGADLIFVHIGAPGSDTVDQELETLGSSNCLCDAVKYIFEKANVADNGEKMPVVINISLGVSGGAHDGTSLVEILFDELLEKSGRAIVIAAGNDYLKQLHTSGKIQPNNKTDISWSIHQIMDPKPWQMRQELEIWYPKGTSLNVEIIDPDHNTKGECRLGNTYSSDNDDIPLVLVKNTAPDPNISKSMNHIDILINNSKAGFISGDWIVRLTHEGAQATQDQVIEFQAWIERNGQENEDQLNRRIGSEFSKDSKKESTINGLANATLPIVVGSYNINEGMLPIEASYFTSAGPTFNKAKKNIKKPELCAPGENIYSAEARTSGNFPHNGTSVAAPHVTGVIALMFQKAKLHPQKPKILTVKKIRKILIDSVEPLTTGGAKGHDNQLGFGRVNALKALENLK